MFSEKPSQASTGQEHQQDSQKLPVESIDACGAEADDQQNSAEQAADASPQGHGGSPPLLYCDTSADKGADTGKPCEQNTCHGRRQCTTPDKRSGQQGEEQERNESDGTP